MIPKYRDSISTGDLLLCIALDLEGLNGCGGSASDRGPIRPETRTLPLPPNQEARMARDVTSSFCLHFCRTIFHSTLLSSSA